MAPYGRWSLITLLALSSGCPLNPAGIGSCLGAAPPPPALVLDLPDSLLKESWTQYRERFIQNDGRVIDRKQGGITTSEGQAYALLRAVWMNDRSTFDRLLRWTQDNLNAGVRPDHLYAWRWGHRDDGSWGVHDRNAASDADQLIAFSLIQAYQRWGDAAHLARARAILVDVWEKETRVVDGVRYVLPGEWSGDSTQRINPSYYLPFAYRTFATIDADRDWIQLVDVSYRVLEQCRSRVGLPTDWCRLDAAKGGLSVSYDLYDRSADFGYDAYRVYWNLAADLLWHQEPRARAALQRMDWLQRYLAVRHELPAVVTVDGIPRELYKSLGLYGAFLPALVIIDPAQAVLLYRQEIAPTYNKGMWGDPEDYYVQNLVWFGLALQSGKDRPSPG